MGHDIVDVYVLPVVLAPERDHDADYPPSTSATGQDVENSVAYSQ